MKKEKILKELYSLKDQLKTKNLYPVTLKELIEAMKHDVKLESIPETSKKTRYNAILKFLNSKTNKSRPILQITHLENDYQVFTDSYAAFRFYGDDIMQQLPKTTDEEYRNYAPYPKMDNLINPVIEEAKREKSFLVEDLKKEIKITEKERIFLDLDENTKVKLVKKLLSQFIKILGYKNKQEITFNYIYSDRIDYVRPLYIKHSETREGILLPCRWTEEEIKEVK